jgi:hypothetical protein
MTRQELEQTKFGGGDNAKPVVRHDNHRELARDAVNDVMQQSVTDERLNTLLPRELGGSRSSLSPPPSRLRQEFDDRVALFGRTTTELWNFSPPGWESSGGNPAACFKLACEGAQQTAGKGESPVGGGGVILYDKVAQRIKTDADASRLALSQIKEHIDAGKSVVAGVNEPGQGHVVDAKKQPVTDHFVAISGYETDSSGRITALLARDNATSKATDIRFEVRADGSIVKPADP